jgi:hypothetical protein
VPLTPVEQRTSPANRAQRFDARRELVAFVELFALCGFAIAQPLLDVFGRAPEVFVFHRAERADIVGFAATVVLGPPLVLWAGGLLVGVFGGAVARRLAHRCTIGALAVLLAIQLLRKATPLSGFALAALAIGLGALAAVLVARRGAQLWLRFAAPAPLAFAALFLFSSPVSSLVTADASAVQAVANVEANGTPVVVLMLDELPTSSLLDAHGNIDAERYPNLATIAADGTWFRNATGVADFTQRAVLGPLTGKYPPNSDSTATWSDHPDNLFRLVGGAYDMHVIESLTVLCPPTVCTATDDGERDAGSSGDAPGIDAGLAPVLREARQVYGDLVALHEPEASAVATLTEAVAPATTTTTAADPLAPLPADGVEPGIGNIELDPDARTAAQPVRVTEFLDSLSAQQPGEPPGFWFLHVVLPHNPFHLLPGGGQYALPSADAAMPGLGGTLRWDDDPWPALAGRQRHLLQLRAVDEMVGLVLERLRSLDLYDRALLVVTADHGASFHAGGSFRQLTDENPSQVAWVPLLVKRPGERGVAAIDDRNAETIDVLPTIADVLDIDVPWPIDGRSLFGAPRDPATKVFRTAPMFPNGADDYREVTLDGPRLFAEMLASPLLAHDPDGVDAAILRSGPYGELIGRSVHAVASGLPDTRTAVIDDLDAYGDVDLTQPLPALVRGRLEDGDGDETVVVAVNGTIAGVSPTFADREEPARFTILVPPWMLRAGRNDVRAFLLSEPGGTVTLAPTPVG